MKLPGIGSLRMALRAAAPSFSTRRGFALPVVLFCLLAVAALVGASLTLARRETLAGEAVVAAVQARLAAESGVRMGAADLDQATLGRLARRGTLAEPPVALVPGVHAGIRLVRIRPEWIWIEGSGTDLRGGLRAERKVGAVWWSLEGASRLSELPAVAEHGGALTVPAGGTLEGGDAIGSPPDWPVEACASLRTVLDSLNPAGMRPALAWTPSVPAEPAGLERIPRLGLLDGTALYDRATLRPGVPRVGPGPGVGGTGCWTDPLAAQGPPDRPPGVCGDRFPLVVTGGSLEVEGGAGQGILAVGGDLVLGGGTRFAGLALVGGSVRIESGSTLRGVVRARNRIVVAGLLAGSPCAALRALRSPSALSRPLPAPGGGWIPLP